MAQNRTIKKVIRSKPTIEGAGVHLRRAFGFGDVPLFDPFLMLDDFRADQAALYLKGFPWHPHRGIETITYVLRGQVEHGDSLGKSGTIGGGEIQWMTAGSGIIHQEMPKGDPDGAMGGFQLWLNLPASHKMMDPRYRGVQSAEVPVVTLPSGGAIRVICGTVEGTHGPIQDTVVEASYLDVSLPAKAQLIHPTTPGHTVLAYVIEGKAHFCQQQNPFAYEVQGENYFDLAREAGVPNQSVVLFNDGDQLVVSADQEPTRFLLFTGKPIGEPVAWYGPIVMNTRAELELAFDEYAKGTFVKRGAAGD